MAGEVSDALRRQVAGRAFRVCEYCLVHEDDLYHGCEVDHIRSLKHGGLTTADNLAFACFHCNRHKGSDLGSISQQSGTLVRLFNLRGTKPLGTGYQLPWRALDWGPGARWPKAVNRTGAEGVPVGHVLRAPRGAGGLSDRSDGISLHGCGMRGGG